MSEAVELRDDVLRIEKINDCQSCLYDRAVVIFDYHSIMNSVSGNRFYRISSTAGESIYDFSDILNKDSSKKRINSIDDSAYSLQSINIENGIKLLPEDYSDGEVETVNLSQPSKITPTQPLPLQPHVPPQPVYNKPVMPQTVRPQPVPTPASDVNRNYAYEQPAKYVQPPVNPAGNNENENNKLKVMTALPFFFAIMSLITFVSGISVVLSVISIVLALNIMNKVPEKSKKFLRITIALASMGMFLGFVASFLI